MKARQRSEALRRRAARKRHGAAQFQELKPKRCEN